MTIFQLSNLCFPCKLVFDGNRTTKMCLNIKAIDILLPTLENLYFSKCCCYFQRVFFPTVWSFQNSRVLTTVVVPVKGSANLSAVVGSACQGPLTVRMRVTVSLTPSTFVVRSTATISACAFQPLSLSNSCQSSH